MDLRNVNGILQAAREFLMPPQAPPGAAPAIPQAPGMPPALPNPNQMTNANQLANAVNVTR